MAKRKPKSLAEQMAAITQPFQQTHGGLTPTAYNEQYKAGTAPPVSNYTGAPYTPPFGSYDPSLLSGQRAAHRGYGDLTDDVNTAGARDAADVGIQIGDINRQRDETLTDLTTGRTRERDDLNTAYTRTNEQSATQRKRLNEDLTTNLGNLARNYTNLAASQGGQQRAAGVKGGALVQAARKRGENQERDRSGVQQGYDRAESDLSTSTLNAIRDIKNQELRGEGDYITGTNRTRESADRATGEVNRQYGYRNIDRGTQLARGGRELNWFDHDTQQSVLAQVLQTDPNSLADYNKQVQRWKSLYK